MQGGGGANVIGFVFLLKGGSWRQHVGRTSCDMKAEHRVVLL